MLRQINSRRILLALLLPLCFAGAAQAQAPFEIVVQSGANTAPVSNGSTLTLAANAVGQSTSLTMTLTYEGVTSVVVSQPTLSSTNGFSLGASSITSTPITPGQAVNFTVTYTPATAAQATTQLSIPYTQAGATSNSAGTAGSLIFVLSGTAPNMVVTYALSTNANVTPVGDGGTIPFPPTVVGGSTTATMTIVNEGSGPGSIQNIVLSADSSFVLTSKPLLPVQSLAAGSNVQFSLTYAPTQAGTNSGTLEIDLPQKITLALQGTAMASLFSYQLVQGSQTSALTPGQTITFPNTNAGDKISSSVTILMKNTSPTTVTGITAAVSGTGFSITDQPLSTTLIVGGTNSYTVTFAPTQAGAVTGRFQVGNDTFNLSGTAIGVQLTYSYSSGSASNPVVSGGTVSFPPETVGQTVTTAFTVQNNGTTPAQITSVGISGTQTTPPTFSLPNPWSPVSLPAGQSTQFTISFTPQTTGQSTAPLVINDQQFTLSGFGNAPGAIPSYQFTGASGNETPLTQAPIGLSLATPYSLALTGKLTLNENTGSLPSDSSVQFSSGGQTVTFTIPQGSTQAIFPSGSNQISLQTGSVAGTITITPSFALASGLDVTPASPATLSLSVPSGPVQLTNALVSAISANSLTLQITGYATTRDLSSLSFQFTTSSSSSTVPVPIGPYAQQWFSSTQSDSFGGQFSVSVPFTLSNGQTSSTTSLVNQLQSISITASNSAGKSNAVVVSLAR